MNPKIMKIQAIHCVGLSAVMTLTDDSTFQLWQRFMPRIMPLKKQNPEAFSAEYFSINVYSKTLIAEIFENSIPYKKWAAVSVVQSVEGVEQFESITIPAGEYAVFRYRGLPQNAEFFFEKIFKEWLPGSGFELDFRPHFALMGDLYKQGDPLSEEDIYIPIQRH